MYTMTSSLVIVFYVNKYQYTIDQELTDAAAYRRRADAALALNR